MKILNLLSDLVLCHR